MNGDKITILVKHLYQGGDLPIPILQEGTIATLPADQARYLLTTFPDWFAEVEVQAAGGEEPRARVKGSKTK